jgi:hypothetical protein
MALGNVYDPTQGAGDFDLEEAMQDPVFMDLLSQMGWLPGPAEMPQGRAVGGTFRAAHPLEFVAAAAQNILRGIKGPKMNLALAKALRGRRPVDSGMPSGLKADPYDWGYEGADFSPGGTHEGWT